MSRFATALVLTCAVGGICGVGRADSVDDRFKRLEERLDQVDKKYQQELQARDEKIASLEKDLERAKANPEAARKADEVRAAVMKKVTDDIISDIETRKKDDPLARVAAIANPDIAVVADFLGNVSSRNVDATRNRMDVREAELDIRAAVDPRADAVLVASFARDAFPDLFGKNPVDEVDSEASIEEAYLFLHDFGVPNLTARLGRYHVRFGRQNILHSHDLPTVDPAYVNQSFLAPEALVDSGVEFSYLIPNPWNEYFEIITSINSGEGASSESTTLRGGAKARSPSVVSHFLWNKNLSKNVNLEIGLSNLWGPSESEEPDQGGTRRDVWLYGSDITLVRRDPSGGFFNQLLQGEAIYGHTRQADGSMQSSYGGYVLGQQQLAKDWYAGLRLDWTKDANDSTKTIFGASPYLSWYWSEFLRFRVQYEYRGGDVPAENLLFFQVTWIYGAHPPHPYWAMK